MKKISLLKRFMKRLVSKEILFQINYFLFLSIHFTMFVTIAKVDH